MTTPTATTNTAPLYQRTVITPGTAWTGPNLRETLADGTHPDLTILADVRTSLDPSGFLVGSCSVDGPDDDGYYSLSLSSTDTASFPTRLLYISVSVTVDGPNTEPRLAMQIVADVMPYTSPTPAP